MSLTKLGWNKHFEDCFESFRDSGAIPGRVSLEHRNLYHVLTEQGEMIAEVTGNLRHNALSRADFPAVGDWVVLQPPPDSGNSIILGILPRISRFSRKAILSGGMPDTGGKTDEQVIGANIDTVFLVNGLDGDFNLRRMERYLAIAWDSGASPVVVLNKIDMCDDLETVVADTEAVAIGVPVLTVSAKDRKGLAELRAYLGEGKTGAFLGSSGVGKSSIINEIIGEKRLKVGGVREYDNKGKHTTTHRQLIVLPDGGMVIDTPGLRQLAIWSDDEGLEHVFGDIEALSRQCRFSDCRHQSEPGCAVREALENGDLDPGRYESYQKLQKELLHLKRRQNKREERLASKQLGQKIKQINKDRKQMKKRGLI